MALINILPSKGPHDQRSPEAVDHGSTLLKHGLLCDRHALMSETARGAAEGKLVGKGLKPRL